MDGSWLDDELSRTDAVLSSCGAYRRLVRPPRGSLSARVLFRTARLGYTTALWSLDSDDCRTRDPLAIEQRVAEAATPGDVVLFHEMQSWTLEALPGLVRRLRRDAWQLVTLSDLMA
jgi:peptidoglycan/xylan/chitin deacetylase (PgdA/CDA1 family)